MTGQDIPAVETGHREGDPPALYADPSKIKRKVGWPPRYADIAAIFETTWRWQHAHPDGYADRPR